MRVEGISFEGKSLVVKLDREFNEKEKTVFMHRLRWVFEEMDRVWQVIAKEAKR